MPWKQPINPSGKTPPRSKPTTPLGGYDMSQFNVNPQSHVANNQSKFGNTKHNPFFSKYNKANYQ